MNPFRRRRPLLLPLAALLFLAGSAAAQPFSETLFSEMRWRMIGPFRGGRTVAAISFRDWHPVGAEEYGYVAPDPLDPDVVYGGKLTRFRHSTGDVKDVSPAPVLGKYRFLRTAPVLFSPADPHVLFYAGNVLFKTANGGKTWDVVSPDLSRETPDVPESIGVYRKPEMAKQPRRGVIYTVAAGKKDVNVIWAGTDDGLIHRTLDGGKTWANVTPLRQLDAKTDSARPRRRASLEEKLLHLYGIIESADDAPTAQAVAAVDELTAR